jgi:hypothetical protein
LYAAPIKIQQRVALTNCKYGITKLRRFVDFILIASAAVSLSHLPLKFPLSPTRIFARWIEHSLDVPTERLYHADAGIRSPLRGCSHGSKVKFGILHFLAQHYMVARRPCKLLDPNPLKTSCFATIATSE